MPSRPPSTPAATDRDGGVARPSQRATTLRPSAIREIYDAAQQVPGALRLEVGEPDFDTPPWIVEAAHRAAVSGATHYTSNLGIGVLREALADKVRRVNGYDATPAQVMVAAGGVQALHVILHALLDPGDEVLLPDPLWPNFMMIAHLASARAVTYALQPALGFLPSIEQLESLVTARTRVLVVNLPSNPTGACATDELWRELVGFARRRGLWLVSDECYDQITFDGVVRSAQAIAPYERTVAVHTFSKTYAMTGWRVGYAVGPEELVTLVGHMQEPSVSCVNTPAQYAALAAIEGPQDVVAAMCDAYRRRAAAALEILTAGGVPAHRPDGAFYLWVDTSADGRDSLAVAHGLLHAEQVAVAPGLAFGPAGAQRVRVSLASADDDLAEGCRRLVRYLQRERA